MSVNARRSSSPLGGLRVLVAGAGLAGLSAAFALETDGADVTIVDARDRVGGRVWTLRDGFAGGQHAEAGADLIEDGQQAVRDLARELGLETRACLRGGFGYYGLTSRGRRAMQPEPPSLTKVLPALRSLIHTYHLAEQRWDGVIASRLGRQSVAEWLSTQSAPAWVRERAAALRGLFLADPEDLSLLAWVDYLAEAPSGVVRDGIMRVVGGNDRLATGLAARLRRPVETGVVLRALEQRPRRIIASLERGGRVDRWHGDFVVCALPASTLRHVAMTPVLPEAQADAIARLRYGAATRVLLQFERPFWCRRGRPRAWASAQAHGAVWDAAEGQRGRGGVLSLLAGGGAARDLARLHRQRGMGGIVSALGWLGRPAPLVHGVIVRWDRDPWAGGGYAYFDPGFPPAWRDLLARPAGRVVFAGEHTSQRWQGYMNGAIESGQRAAAEIAALVSRTDGGTDL